MYSRSWKALTLFVGVGFGVGRGGGAGQWGRSGRQGHRQAGENHQQGRELFSCHENHTVQISFYIQPVNIVLGVEREIFYRGEGCMLRNS